MKQPSLFDEDASPPAAAAPPDQAARDFAVDPRHDVVLEASAGTGKTRVLVDRYVRLLESGVDPRNILAITFTRKAAAEMRARVVAALAERAERGALSGTIWQRVRERMGDVQISTIDAFCFGLLREFPLEADVDPAFEVADETEMARFAVEALDLALRAARRLAKDDETIRLLLVRVKTPVLREALATLIDRRQIALGAIASFVRRVNGPATAADAGARFVARLRAAIEPSPWRSALVDDGPHAVPEFAWLAAELRALDRFPSTDPARVQYLRRRLERYFLTTAGKPRKQIGKIYKDALPVRDVRQRHEKAVEALAPAVDEALAALDADIDHLLARGLLRVLAVAVRQYESLLDEHALLDFTGMLDRAIALLERQEEFARSRLKLQARYHHLLVDEFQDTSRRQWRLIDRLIAAWAEGEGAADAATSVFVVGDRKQSIYRFRHADVTLLDEAARRIAALRPGRRVRQAITTSFRAVPELLAFVNALAAEMSGDGELDDRWRYDETDRFPVPPVAAGATRDGHPVLGLIAESSLPASAAAVADEIVRLIGCTLVRDRATGMRPAGPGDIAILFRARAGHQYFEDALAARGVKSYVYKGLGFFDAPEVQDLQALIRYLAQPDSDLRAAELLRSRFVRLSDAALVRLAPAFADALQRRDLDLAALGLADIDARLLAQARASAAVWIDLASRVPPSELVDVVLRDSAYVFETRGVRSSQAKENVKKVRSLIRRVESRGYATLGRLARYFDTLRAGDDSNAMIEATDAVNLMTMHAAKGLEFPIVFLVNLHAPGRGRPAGCSIVERGPSGEPEVTFGSTPATKLEERRETEELRRLLYVATTRARDRLYLAAQVDPATSRLKRGARSLAGLLPASLAALFGTAASTSEATVLWESSAGSFLFDVCRPSPAVAGAARTADVPEIFPPAPVVPPVVSTSRGVLTATALTASEAEPPAAPSRAFAGGSGHERLVGTLVHRMFQRRFDPALPDDVLGAAVASLIGQPDLVDLDDPRVTAREAVEVFRALRSRPDIEALLASGECLYEVPMSFLAPDGSGACVRGAVDCVVVAADGRTTVLELKTGRPRPEHEAQAALYARAVEAAFGAGPVNFVVCYP
jgi:ATP-dependent helicase/nuclease subunit A